MPGIVARSHRRGQLPAVDRSAHVQQMAHLGVLARLRPGLLHLHGGNVRHGEMAGASNAIGIGPQLNNMRTQQQGRQNGSRWRHCSACLVFILTISNATH